MGVEIAELSLSWRRLQHRDRLLTNIVSFFLLMGLFAFTLNGGSIDQMGHLGGLICGAAYAPFPGFPCQAPIICLDSDASHIRAGCALVLQLCVTAAPVPSLVHVVGSFCCVAGLSLGFLFNGDMPEKPAWWKFAFWGSIMLLIALPVSCIPVVFAVDRGCAA